MALLDNLISFWELEEASGTRADAHGLNHLTPVNSPASAAGKVGSALDNEVTLSQYAERASNVDLQTGDIDFTIQAWVFAEAGANMGLFPVIAHKGWQTTGPTTREWALYYDGGGSASMAFEINPPGLGTTIKVKQGPVLGLTTWALYHAWHDSINNVIGISRDGGTAVTLAATTGVNSAAGIFQLAGISAQSLYWDGLIDQVGFWKRVLTPAERTQLYNSGNGMSYSAMAAGSVSSKNNAMTGMSGLTGGGDIDDIY